MKSRTLLRVLLATVMTLGLTPLMTPVNAVETAGTPDTAFNANFGSGFNDRVYSVVVQTDGKILVGGDFTDLNGVTVNGLARLNADGTPDTVFNDEFAVGFDDTVYSVVVQADGKILVGGDFNMLNGVTVNGLARLNADGTPDTVFNDKFGTGWGFDDEVFSVVVQAGGQILVGGWFTTLTTPGVETDVNGLARLNADGTPDATFNANIGTGFTSPGFPGSVRSIVVQTVGGVEKILVGGGFDMLDDEDVNRLARLNADGTPDTVFNGEFAVGFDDTVYSVVLQADGKILVGGWFEELNGDPVNSLARLDADGTPESLFNEKFEVGFRGSVRSIVVQTVEGVQNILVGGSFDMLNSDPVNGLARLEVNGDPDTVFNDEFAVGFDDTVRPIVVQPDGKILVGGSFTELNGVTVNGLARLEVNGDPDTAFNAKFGLGVGFDGTVTTVALQPDGKILVGGFLNPFDLDPVNRLVRLNDDGTPDTEFNDNLRDIEFISFSAVTSIAVQADGRILVGGIFLAIPGIIPSVVRLNANGTFDGTFDFPLFDDFVYSVVVQSDGKILVGGEFTTLTTHGDETDVNQLARLEVNGDPDTAFNANFDGGVGFDGTVTTVALQPDGKILVGGILDPFRPDPVNRLVRLNDDGTPDTDFNDNLLEIDFIFSAVTSIAVQADGGILVGGIFLAIPGIIPSVVRLNANGTFDDEFGYTLFDDFVNSVVVQADGKILVGGEFTTLTTPGDETEVNGLARLNADGTPDTVFNAKFGTDLGFNNAVWPVVVQPDGKILVGGFFTELNGVTVNRLARLFGGETTTTTDPSLWTTYFQALPLPASGSCRDITVEQNTFAAYNSGVTGGWVKGWEPWVNEGTGGFACWRLLVNRGGNDWRVTSTA